MAPKVWRIIVWNVAPHLSGLMARLKMAPAKNTPTTFWRHYQTRDQVLKARDLLAAAGLRGVCKLVDAPAKPDRFRKKPYLAVSREGFGRQLNATPIKSSWRRKARR